MRADLRTRIEAWLGALEERAARIDTMRSQVPVVTARAIDAHVVYCIGQLPEGARYAIAGPEKCVPPNYEFDASGLRTIPLEEWDGFLTGDSDTPWNAESVRTCIASLRFETSLL
jgi:hypothetical protein